MRHLRAHVPGACLWPARPGPHASGPHASGPTPPAPTSSSPAGPPACAPSRHARATGRAPGCAPCTGQQRGATPCLSAGAGERSWPTPGLVRGCCSWKVCTAVGCAAPALHRVHGHRRCLAAPRAAPHAHRRGSGRHVPTQCGNLRLALAAWLPASRTPPHLKGGPSMLKIAAGMSTCRFVMSATSFFLQAGRPGGGGARHSAQTGCHGCGAALPLLLLQRAQERKAEQRQSRLPPSRVSLQSEQP